MRKKSAVDCMRRVHTPPLEAKKGYVPGDKYLTKTTYPVACGGVVVFSVLLKRLSLVLSFLIFLAPLSAQTSSSSGTSVDDSKMISTEFDTSGFPQWARDLRRGEIIAFGSFPFAYFFSNFAVDIYRSAMNDWDNRYAPWPFDGAGSIGKDKSERLLTIGVAATTSILIALVDYGIERYKRNRAEKEIENLPEGTPIIIRRPLMEDNGDDSGGAEVPEQTVPEIP